ncbi:hypothetical protein ACF06T_30680 [Streptomyces albidoflavus]
MTETAPRPADDLRKQIARALVRYDWNAGLSGRATPSAHHYGEADAVMAVLPAPVDRATVLYEAADHLAQQADELWAPGRTAHTTMHADADELRRMAAEAKTEGPR